MNFDNFLKSYFGDTGVEVRPDGWNELLDAVRIAKAVHNYTLRMAAQICRERQKNWSADPPVGQECEHPWMAEGADLCAKAIEARIKD